LFEICLKPNQGAFFGHYSIYPHEKEILLPAFCEFNIMDIRSSTNLKWYIILECLYVNTQNYTKVSSSKIKNISEGFIYSIPFKDISHSGEVLGKGGFGTVYKGKLDVAIKTLHLSDISVDDLDDFKHEISIMSQLQSPNIVHLFGACFEQNHYSIVMEYFPNGDLSTYLSKNNNIPWKTRYQIASDITSGLSYLHKKGIIHADLKSLNILLDQNYCAKITDFGVSKLRLTSQTVAGPHNAGSARWMAPELWEPLSKSNKSSDIYSLGMVLWELTSYKIPFIDTCQSDQQVMFFLVMKNGQEKIPQDTPQVLAQNIQMCWDRDPVKRPTADNVLVALKQELEKM